MSDPLTQVSVEYILSNGVHRTPTDVSLFIEEEVRRTGDRYLEVIMDYCERHELEPETIAQSLTESLRQKLEAECSQYNLLNTKFPTLPD